MYKKKLLLLSYPLGYFGLFAFTKWVAGLFFTQEDSLLVRTLLVLGALATLVLILILQDGSYLAKLIDCFPQEIRNKCQHYISYLDRVSLCLFIGLAVSVFVGEPFYSPVTEFLLYIAFGFYVSSSAVILLFLSRK